MSGDKDFEVKPLEGLGFGDDWLDELEDSEEIEALPWDRPSKHEQEAIKPLQLEILNVKEERERVFEKTGEPKPQVDLGTQIRNQITLILIRLFDDLELILVEGYIEECLDLSKQIYRLGNLLSLVGKRQYLALLAYVYQRLPLRHKHTAIGELAELYYDATKQEKFAEAKAEILHCFFYLVQTMETEFEGLDITRFKASAMKLYESMRLLPANPSPEAPLPGVGTDSKALTSRTIHKVARSLDGLITESIHLIESAALYGYGKGYEEACSNFEDATQIASEFGFEDLIYDFQELIIKLGRLKPKDKPTTVLFPHFESIFAKLGKHFPHLKLARKQKQIFNILSQFSVEKNQKSPERFDIRWHRFKLDLEPIATQVLSGHSLDLDELVQICNIAREHKIDWLYQIFETFRKYWKIYPKSSQEALLILLEDIKSLEPDHVNEDNLQELMNDKLRILFERKLQKTNATFDELVIDTEAFLHELSEALTDPALFPNDRLQNLLIDARALQCHGITRVCECFDLLLQNYKNSEGQDAGDFLIEGLFFCSELLKKLLLKVRVLKDLEQSREILQSLTPLYEVLLEMYVVEGEIKEPLSMLLYQQFSETANALELVWSNTATPSASDYYYSLLGRLLHFADLMELGSARTSIVEHLSEIPNQDFINTSHLTLQRQCMRIVRSMEQTLRSNALMQFDHDIAYFFKHTIASCSFYASTFVDEGNRTQIVHELQKLESSLISHALKTHFTPIIIVALELRALSRSNQLHVEDFNNYLFWLLRLAHVICPLWDKSEADSLDHLNFPLRVPMNLYLRQARLIEEIYHAFKEEGEKIPHAWEALSNLRQNNQLLQQSPKFLLSILVNNARNHCAYLKKSIAFIGRLGSAHSCEKPVGNAAILHAFMHCIDNIVEMLITAAFHVSNISSYIEICLACEKSALSVSIIHNGENFTYDEVVKILTKINLIPAPDDDLFDLLAQEPKLYKLYPPLVKLSYILPIIRQYHGVIDMHTMDSKTYISLVFPVH